MSTPHSSRPDAVPLENAPVSASGAQRTHPLAIASLVVSAMGLVPLPIIGGLLGSLLGAFAIGTIKRQPERYRGTGVAIAGLVVGLVTGVVLLAVICGANADSWGWVPFFATIGYGALVIGLSVIGHTTAGRAGGVVALGTVGIIAAVAMAVGMVLLITLMFTVIFEGFLDALLGRD